MILIEKYKAFHPIVKFIVNGVFLFLLWFIFYKFFRYSGFVNNIYEKSTGQLTYYLLYFSELLLNVFGFETEMFGKTIRIVGTGGVYLDRGCLGRNVMGLFAGFVIAYPGIIKKKLWFIPLGLLIINFVNVLRICGLAYIALCCPEHMDINHHLIFKYAVYTVIFLLWFWWIQKINVRAVKNSN
ncbi:MAG: archaeosortase/exosortase family protein [Bacteroidales bacterium]|nr:archaeosortase/exosortase family protein [Bacteroidales bacterium]MBN2756723.1 archaeosortase/exosortase family protein [Bacteroidales bacterium]